MSFADYNEFIQRELVPEIVDTVITKPFEPWTSTFGSTMCDDGDRITSKYVLTRTSNAAAYTKSDVNPASSTQVIQKPYWDKLFYHGACEAHGIDISNNKVSGHAGDILATELKAEVAQVMDVVVAAFYTQLKKDVDSTSVAYSDASLSRSTYATLASYEEATDATITVAYMRGMINNMLLNHPVNLADYVCLMEGSVQNTLRPLAAALHAWNINDPGAGSGQAMGYRPMVNFEGLDIANSGDFHSMTTGDVLALRKQDVNVCIHRPLEVEAVASGRDSIKLVPRIGANIYTDNPGYQAKMTSKD